MLAQPAGELVEFGRTASAAGDQGKASCHTTHNVYVLLLFFVSRLGEKESDSEPTRASRLRQASAGFDRPSISVRKLSISRTIRPAPAATAPRRHGRCRSPPPGRSHGPARARRSARRCRPGATRRPASAPAACRRARERRRVDVVTGDPLVKFAHVGVGLVVARKGRAERHHRAHLLRMHDAPARARTCRRGSSRPAAPAARRRSRRAGARAAPACLALAPRLMPSPHGCARHPARASARRISIVVRSLARKPGMTSAGGPSSGPARAQRAKAASMRGRCHATSRQPLPGRRRKVVRVNRRRPSPAMAVRAHFMPSRWVSFRYRNKNAAGISCAFSGTCRFRAPPRARRRARHAERHVGAVELDLLVALMVEPARGARRDQPVAARP